MNLLIIDDDVETINVASSILTYEYSQYNIFSANSLKKAKEILKLNRIDFVLCDLKLRGEKGSDILLSYPHKDKIIFITGYNKERIELEKNTSEFLILSKPVDYKLVHNLILSGFSKEECEEMGGNCIYKDRISVLENEYSHLKDSIQSVEIKLDKSMTAIQDMQLSLMEVNTTLKGSVSESLIGIRDWIKHHDEALTTNPSIPEGDIKELVKEELKENKSLSQHFKDKPFYKKLLYITAILGAVNFEFVLKTAETIVKALEWWVSQ